MCGATAMVPAEFGAVVEAGPCGEPVLFTIVDRGVVYSA